MATDMTKGRIIPQLTTYTIPLVLGNLLQLTYNAADSVIVGRFVGEGALAAVGSAGPVMNMVILFISGMCIGAGILMSSLFGAGRIEALHRQISTAMIGGGIMSLAISVLMILSAHPLLRILKVPQEIIHDAKIYLQIIFVGLIFAFVYNFLANTLRALGESKIPLYFLIVSSVLNVVGDLLFVLVFHMGVIGSAVATVLSEALCCVTCMLYIRRKVPLLCLGKKWLVFDRGMLGKTFSYGITGALQQMCVQLGKICVQTVVNVQGVAFIAAFTAINRVDDFAMMAQQNIAHAAATFMAQNRGAGNIRRMKKGFGGAVAIEVVYTAIVSVIIWTWAEPIMRLFVNEGDGQVVAMGVSYLKIVSILYIMPATTNIMQGFFRGIGDLKVTLISTVMNMAARFTASYLLIQVMHKAFSSLAWANFAGWIVMCTLEAPLLIRHWIILGKKETRGE